MPAWRDNYFVALIFVSGALFSLIVFYDVRQAEQNQYQFEFERRAGNWVALLEKGISGSLYQINAVSNWFIAEKKSGIFNKIGAIKSEFHDVASRVMSKYPSIQFFALAPRASGEERAKFESDDRNAPFPGVRFLERNDKGEIIPAAAGSEYFPLYLVEPHKDGENLFGLNLPTDSFFRDPYMQSRRTKGMFASSRTLLDRGIDDGEHVIFILSPLYESGNADQQDGGTSRTSPFGYLVAALRLETLIETSFDGVDTSDMGGIDLRLYDMHDPGLSTEERFLYESTERSMAAHPKHVELTEIMGSPHLVQNINVAGRPWSAVLHPAPAYRTNVPTWHSLVFLYGGLLITFIVTAYIHKTQKHGRQVENEVSERTKELRRANEDLMREITHRRRIEGQLMLSEKKYRDLFEHASDAILIIDPETRHILDASAVAAEQLGYTMEEFLELTIDAINPPGFNPAEDVSFQRLLKGESVVFERTHRRKDGTTMPVEINAKIVEYGDRKVIQGFVRDVTERKLAEQRAHEASSELAHAMRLASLGEMAVGITHEINQPLGAIMNYSENARDLLGEGQRNHSAVADNLGKISEQVLRIQQVINNLKTLSRKDDTVFSVVDINYLVTIVVSFFSQQFKLKGIQVTSELDPSAPSVYGSSLQLEQVLVNIVLNAIDSIEDTERKTILITTMRELSDNVSVSISDSGTGIDKDLLAKLFKPFITTKPAGKGTGLGLSISRKIVENHGGTITAQSRAGEGTTILITIPLHSNGGGKDR